MFYILSYKRFSFNFKSWSPADDATLHIFTFNFVSIMFFLCFRILLSCLFLYSSIAFRTVFFMFILLQRFASSSLAEHILLCIHMQVICTFIYSIKTNQILQEHLFRIRLQTQKEHDVY